MRETNNNNNIKNNNIMNETFKLIQGFDNYAVSNLGNVKNINLGGVLVNRIHHTGGNLAVNIKSNEGKFKTMGVHRLVAIAFVDNPNNNKEVVFIDGDKTNCKAENLKWKENKAAMKSTDPTKIKVRRSVKCLETGEEFESMYKCAMKYGKAISSVLYGRAKSYKGMHFVFI